MVTERKRAAPLRREGTPPDVEWRVAAMGWERDSRFSGQWAYNRWLKEMAFSLYANILTLRTHRGLGQRFRLFCTHCVDLDILCPSEHSFSEVTDLFEFGFYSIQLTFLFAKIQLQNQFFKVGEKGVID